MNPLCKISEEVEELLDTCPEQIVATFRHMANVIGELEAKLATIGKSEDPFRHLYDSLNMQVMRLSEDMRLMTVTMEGDDRAFERFIKLQESLRKMIENMEYLAQKTGAKEKSEEKKKVNPMEARANGSAATK